MHDKKLSFIFLLHLINYKKFKSLKKRFLLANFTLFRSFLPCLKYSLYYSHKRLWFNKFNDLNFFSPVFFIKRMFGKKNNILSHLDVSNIKYIWRGGKSFTILNKNKYFFKNPININGNTINLTSKPENFPDNFAFLNKDVVLSSPLIDFNSYMFFNISLLSTIEIYTSLMYCYIYHSYKN